MLGRHLVQFLAQPGLPGGQLLLADLQLLQREGPGRPRHLWSGGAAIDDGDVLQCLHWAQADFAAQLHGDHNVLGLAAIVL